MYGNDQRILLLWIENIVIRHLKVGVSISLLNANQRYKAREKEKYMRNGKLEAKLLNLGNKRDTNQYQR